MINTIVVYDTALCNLSCRYCFISKNKSLLEIDNELAESFKGSYYIDLAKELIDNISQVNRLEIWGGEPSLHLNRTFNFMEDLIKESPVFDNIFFSSNFYSESILLAVKALYDFLKKHTERKFNVCIQVSIDGPAEITDQARGIGVTKQVIANFSKLIEISPPSNVELKLHLKPTLDRESMKLLLDRKCVIDYYKFFENNFLDKVDKLNSSKITIKNCPIPNLAIPSAHTQDDGLTLAAIIKVMREIEAENEITPIFKYYKKITLFSKHDNYKPPNNCKLKGGFCGSGRNMIGLLPHKKSCGCHRSFTDYLENYKKDKGKDIQEKMIISNELGATSITDKVLIFNSKYDMQNHIIRMGQFYNKPSTSIVTNMAILIRTLVYVGQIDKKYKNENRAIEGAYDIINTHAMCLNDLISLTGSVSMCYTSLIKLFLNGAAEHIFKREETIDE